MRIVIAPDSFKESLTAVEAAAAMAAGVQDAVPDVEIITVPIADGGEGTVAAMATALGGVSETVTVVGPREKPTTARYGFHPATSTAIIEVAEAVGIHLVSPADRDIWRSSSRGVGELLNHVRSLGARNIIIGLGGSVTTDGGLGMLTSLGLVPVDSAGQTVSSQATGLLQCAGINHGEFDCDWSEINVIIASDVDNPLCGPAGAAYVFAPQKGASPGDLAPLDAALAQWANSLEEYSGKTIRDVPGAGAAGGLGAALMAVFDTEIRSGAELLLDRVQFRKLCAGAHLVLTGEGKLDSQTRYGKGPAKVAEAARGVGVPVVGFGGAVDDDTRKLVPDLFSGLVQVSDPMEELTVSLADAGENLRRKVASYLADFSQQEGEKHAQQ